MNDQERALLLALAACVEKVAGQVNHDARYRDATLDSAIGDLRRARGAFPP